MKNKPQAISVAATENQETHRTPDCVTEVRKGNTILTVSGYFKQGVKSENAASMANTANLEAG